MLAALVIVLLISINALYVAAEFSSVSSRRTRISQLAGEGNRFASLLLPILNDPDRLDNYVAACQLGITASSLFLGFYGQSTLAGMVQPLLEGIGGLGEATAQSVAATGVLVILTTLQVLLGELVPKSVGVRFPERLAMLTVLPMRWSAAILRPFTWLFNGAGRLILRLLRVPAVDSHRQTHLPEEIEQLVVESARGGVLDADEGLMLRNVFRLSEMVARHVMVPRRRMVAASVDSPLRELLATLADSPYTRIPIYGEDIDHILGLIHLKDLFRLCFRDNEPEAGLRDLIREIPFVPESMELDELWSLLKAGQHYMAIVFDEYGGTAGLVTLEDLIEEVFGEFQDEFDRERPPVDLDRGTGSALIRGDILVTDVNDSLLVNLPLDRADTIGGLVTAILRRPAVVGECVSVGALELCVQQVDDLAVTQLSLALPIDHKLPALHSDSGTD